MGETRIASPYGISYKYGYYWAQCKLCGKEFAGFNRLVIYIQFWNHYIRHIKKIPDLLPLTESLIEELNKTLEEYRKIYGPPLEEGPEIGQASP